MLHLFIANTKILSTHLGYLKKKILCSALELIPPTLSLSPVSLSNPTVISVLHARYSLRLLFVFFYAQFLFKQSLN